MDFVNKVLEIDDEHWIRFNPDEKDFDITKVSEFHKRMCSRNGYNIYCKVCAYQKMTKNKS